MDGFDLELRLDASGTKGPARTQAESDADAAAGQAMLDQKHARLRDLQAAFEAEGHEPERAKVMAAQAYHQE